MKNITALCLVITLIGVMTVNPAWADRFHGGGHYGGGHYGGGYGGGYRGGHRGYGYGALGLGLGLGLGYGIGSYYGGYNNYAYSPTIVEVPVAPPVYIQQSPAPVVQQAPSNYWYYCQNPNGYYPYVRECPNGWQQVAPTPPAPPQ